MKVTYFLSFGYLAMSWDYNIFSLVANKLRTTSMAISALYCLKIVFIFIPLCMHVCVSMPTCVYIHRYWGQKWVLGPLELEVLLVVQCWYGRWDPNQDLCKSSKLLPAETSLHPLCSLSKCFSLLCFLLSFCFFVFLHVKLKHHFCATDIRPFINTLTWNNFLLEEAIVLS